MFGSFTHLPDIGKLCPSLGLGAVGMPGYSHPYYYWNYIEVYILKFFQGMLHISDLQSYANQKKEMLWWLAGQLELLAIW